MNTPIIDAITKLSQAHTTRFHMPGHKGKLYPLDFTEIPGADNLICPVGCIAQSQQLHAKGTGAAFCLYSVNGASACNLAAITASVGAGDTIIAARDMHISALNAVRLSGAAVEFVPIEYRGAAPENAVDTGRMIDAINTINAQAVFLTYPNYYGMCCDLSAICEAAHKRNMKVIVDSAHGAHLFYSNLLPPDAQKCGADIWVTSSHKTLPALNQCAVLSGSRAADEAIYKKALNRFQTTSPSYILLCSLDYSRAYMEQQGAKRIEQLLQQIKRFEALPTDDPTKLILDVSKKGFSGFEAEKLLLQDGISIEGSDIHTLILICSVMDEASNFEKLHSSLNNLPDGNTCIREYAYTLEDCKKGEEIAQNSVFIYPPGVPIIAEGQKISPSMRNTVENLRKKGYTLISM